MSKIFIVFIFTLLSQTAFSKTLCLCQTGSQPEVQVPAFKAGCRLWLLGQKQCDEKKISSVDVNLDKILNEDFREGQLQLGFVGHWSGADQTINYITSKVLPIATDLELDVKIDNTACSGMDNAFNVQRFLSQIKSQGFRNKIEFKGNQTTSLGMWDKLLVGDYNLFATANTENEFPDFPSCRDFDSQSCSKLFQVGESGYCKNDSNQLEKLTCQTITKQVVSSSARGPREIRNIETSVWVKTDATKEEEEEDISTVGKNENDQIVDINDPSATKLYIMRSGKPYLSLGVDQKEMLLIVVDILKNTKNNRIEDVKAWNKYMRSKT